MLPKHALYIRCVRKGVRVHSVLQYFSAFRVLDGAENARCEIVTENHHAHGRTNTPCSGQGLRRDGFGLKRKVNAL